MKFQNPDEWYHFTRKEALEDFRLFLSSHEFESLTGLYVKFLVLSGNRVYIIIADSQLNISRTPLDPEESGKATELRRALESEQLILPVLTRINSMCLSDDSMRQHAKSALDSGKTATLVTISFDALFHETSEIYTDAETETMFSAICHRIAQQTGKSNLITMQPDTSLRVALFASIPVDTGMYFTQLMKPMERMFGIWRISRIHIDAVRTSSSLPSILTFLHGEG